VGPQKIGYGPYLTFPCGKLPDNPKKTRKQAVLLDQIPLPIMFAALTGLMVLFMEAGYQIASRWQKKNKAQIAQVRAIMGASLGLLGFMLAFSFSMAQRHFEERTAAYLVEVGELDSAFRSSEMLKPKHRDQAKDLLRLFVQTRLETREAANREDMAAVMEKLVASEQIHTQLWTVATSATATMDESTEPGRFSDAVLAIIKAHDVRLQAGLFNRIPPFIWYTLFFMSLLSMLIMGYQAGLSDARSRLATWGLALTFSVVMMLVTDLDRPASTFFKIDQQLMYELQARMN
jgi:hypothetical protein